MQLARTGSKCLYLSGLKPYFGISGEYWVIKYFKCSVVQNGANLRILRQVRLLDNKKTFFLHKTYEHRDMLHYLMFIYTIILLHHPL